MQNADYDAIAYDHSTMSGIQSAFEIALEAVEFPILSLILNYVLLITCLMSQRQPSLSIRILAFSIIFILSVSSLLTVHAPDPAYGMLIGTYTSWSVLSSANFLFFCDPARDFRRLVAIAEVTKDHDKSSDDAKTKDLWQPMPGPTLGRLFWILDLLGSPRALHWSYGHSSDHTLSCMSKRSLHRSTSFQWASFKLLLVYFGLDCLKEIVAMDPYFWGDIHHEPPRYVQEITASTDLIQAYRMSVAFAVLYLGFELVSKAGFLLWVTVLGPSIAGPWGHKWANLPLFGDLQSVWERGLSGWWGAWWHQIFRRMVTAPADAILGAYQVPRGSTTARSMRIFVAFFFSGIIHACASYGMLGITPAIRSFLFFALQPMGIAIQVACSWAVVRLDKQSSVPKLVCQVANVAFTTIWLIKTYPLVADDYARGGLWLIEPFPFSMLESLGLASEARSQRLWIGYTNHLHQT